VLSGLESLLEIVGLAVIALGVGAGTLSEGCRARVPECRRKLKLRAGTKQSADMWDKDQIGNCQPKGMSAKLNVDKQIERNGEC